ncbi:MAG: rpoB, partial [Aeromicrobium sp.]|nr:rpoB [Aeromicrobium sp.]
MAASRTSAASVQPRRISFAKISEPLEVPELLALQTDSFAWLIGDEKWRTGVDSALAEGRTD